MDRSLQMGGVDRIGVGNSKGSKKYGIGEQKCVLKDE